MDEEKKKEFAGGSIIEFANVVSRYPKLIERACFVYAKQFSTFAQERMTQAVKKILEAAKLQPAAVYVLVEGPSDTIYVRAAIRAAGGDAQQIRVTACGGGSQVLSRARSIAQDQRAASIVTVFDADAAKFQREAETLFKDRPLSRSFLFARGEVEDQFQPSAHAAVLLGRTGAGAKVEDFDPARPIVPQLKKWLWENEKTEFDKVAHAEALVAVLTDVAEYPEPMRHIAEAAIEFRGNCPSTSVSADSGARPSDENDSLKCSNAGGSKPARIPAAATGDASAPAQLWCEADAARIGPAAVRHSVLCTSLAATAAPLWLRRAGPAAQLTPRTLGRRIEDFAAARFLHHP